jgi:hypothetical protein
MSSVTFAPNRLSASYIASTAMGLTVALAWNDAIRKAITKYEWQGGVWITFLYAIFVTLIVIFLVHFIQIGKNVINGTKKEKAPPKFVGRTYPLPSGAQWSQRHY